MTRPCPDCGGGGRIFHADAPPTDCGRCDGEGAEQYDECPGGCGSAEPAQPGGPYWCGPDCAGPMNRRQAHRRKVDRFGRGVGEQRGEARQGLHHPRAASEMEST